MYTHPAIKTPVPSARLGKITSFALAYGIRIMLPPECQLVPDAPDKEYNPGNQNAEFYNAEQDSI
jgi:hypothetical protein